MWCVVCDGDLALPTRPLDGHREKPRTTHHALHAAAFDRYSRRTFGGRSTSAKQALG